MPRKPRIHYPGALYHVMLGGNGGCDVFADAKDRYRFFLLLQEMVERFGCRVYAYSLMDTHIHLALQVGEVELSKVMQNLSSRYTRWSNRRHQKTGHLFQGRYKAILVEEDAYLLQLVSYLHLNPVRAGMTADPADFSWSSHRAYLGQEIVPWLVCDLVLAQLSETPSHARKLFADFVAGEAGKGHRGEFHGRGSLDPRLCGEDDFQTEVLRQAQEMPLKRPDLITTVQCVIDHFGCDLEKLRAPGQGRQLSQVRAFVAWAVVTYSSSTLTALGDLLSRDLSTLSSAVRRLDRQGSKDDDLISIKKDLAAKLTILQA